MHRLNTFFQHIVSKDLGVSSYQLKWHYNLENDAIFATANKTGKVPLFTIKWGKTLLQKSSQKKKQKTTHSGAIMDESKTDAPESTPATDDDDNADFDSDYGQEESDYKRRRSIVKGACKRVSALQKRIDELRAGGGLASSSSSSSAKPAGPAQTADPLRPIVECLAEDPELLEALEEASCDPGGSGGDLIRALVEAELNAENDEGHSMFKSWLADDAAEVSQDSFDKRDAALASILEVSWDLGKQG